MGCRFVPFLLVLFTVAAVRNASAVRCKTIGLYEVKRGNFSVKVTNWGAAVVSVILPDSKGKLVDVALGYDHVASYVNDTTYFGAIVGRVANRIAGAKFWIGGRHYKLFANERGNTLHGGHRGFSHVIWDVTNRQTGKRPFITFAYHSFDGEQGFPGDLNVSITYAIVAEYELSISMLAVPVDKPTPVNLASHTYWNLAGHDSGNILSNELQIFGSHITPLDDALIPSGQLVTVKGTPYDFLQPATIGSRIGRVPAGYDMNYVLDASVIDSLGVRKAAVLSDPKTGRKLELWTNQCGLQLYTSNQLKDVKGKGGVAYGQHSGVCLESQGFPDSVHHRNFPAQIVKPGQPYLHYMLYKFSF